jgi:hypothetical protein
LICLTLVHGHTGKQNELVEIKEVLMKIKSEGQNRFITQNKRTKTIYIFKKTR